jgi:hypothetical protein
MPRPPFAPPWRRIDRIRADYKSGAIDAAQWNAFREELDDDLFDPRPDLAAGAGDSLVPVDGEVQTRTAVASSSTTRPMNVSRPKPTPATVSGLIPAAVIIRSSSGSESKAVAPAKDPGRVVLSRGAPRRWRRMRTRSWSGESSGVNRGSSSRLSRRLLLEERTTYPPAWVTRANSSRARWGVGKVWQDSESDD